jgi:drug/metabolite transporter (DMT)-like permease
MSHGLGDWLSLAALVAVWGTAFTFIRLAVETVPPATIAAGRIVTAALVLLAAVRLVGLRLPSKPGAWAYFLLLGMVGNALPFFLISWGQERVVSGMAGILMAVNPLVTLLLAHFFVAGERLTLARTLGFALGFVGIVVLLGGEAGPGPGGGSLLHAAAVLGGALCYAINSILTRRMPETHPLVASASVLAVAALVVVPVALLLDPPGSFAPSGASTLSVLWLGLVPTAAATLVYFRLVASAGPTFFSLVNYPVPLVAVVTGALVYGERLSWTAFAALGLVLAGIALSQLRGRIPVE